MPPLPSQIDPINQTYSFPRNYNAPGTQSWNDGLRQGADAVRTRPHCNSLWQRGDADCREFQEEVESRMREDMQGASSPVSQPASPSNGSSPFGNFGQSQKAPVQLVKIPAPDLQACPPLSNRLNLEHCLRPDC